MTNEQKIDAIFELCKGLSVQEIYELSQILLRASLRLHDKAKDQHDYEQYLGWCKEQNKEHQEWWEGVQERINRPVPFNLFSW
jgi:hypothetical protein